MTKLISTVVLMLFALAVQAQLQSVEIVPLSDTKVCRGYSTQNIARVQMISDLPNFVNDPEIFVTYTWRADHPKGNKVWNTSSPIRVIPIPWTGDYTIHCTVEFVVLGNSNPFQTISSNTIKVTGKTCEVDLLKQSLQTQKVLNTPIYIKQ